MNIVNVPKELRPMIGDHRLMLEEYFHNYFLAKQSNYERVYLPIMWTTLYHRHLKDALNSIQAFLSTLDKTKKYFTVTIYDDGILNDISGLDIKVFSANNNAEGYYPVPLTYLFRPKLNIKKEYRACYLGHDTHPVRHEIIKLCKDIQGYYVYSGFKGYSFHDELLNKSVFALCPRGYGINSYRVAEALHFGAIPVYISDVFHEPYNIPIEEYGLRISISELSNLEYYLNSIPDSLIERLQINGRNVFNEYFRIDSCCDRIMEQLYIVNI